MLMFGELIMLFDKVKLNLRRFNHHHVVTERITNLLSNQI